MRPLSIRLRFATLFAVRNLSEFRDPHHSRLLTQRPDNIGILHTIFFHRFFPSVLPRTRDVLDLTLPYIENAELETLIDQRTAMLVRQLEAERGAGQGAGAGGGGGLGYGGPGVGSSNHRGGRGQVSVQFFEKRRRKAWYVMRGGEEEVCWESWTVKVTVAEPRTESGRCLQQETAILPSYTD